MYNVCLKDPGYFDILIKVKDDLEKILLKKNLVLSEKDCKSLKQKLGNEKMTDAAKLWLGKKLGWEESKVAERQRRDEAKRKAGRGGEKGPEDENCHWDDTVV